MKCPNCGKELESIGDYISNLDKCEVADCNNPAEFEGWYRLLDNFTHAPTGLIRRANVCEQHKIYLIGGQKEKSQ